MYIRTNHVLLRLILIILDIEHCCLNVSSIFTEEILLASEYGKQRGQSCHRDGKEVRDAGYPVSDVYFTSHLCTNL